jgi:hypothetical protein
LKETFAQILYDLQWYYVMGQCCIFLEWIFWDSWTPPKWILQLVDCKRKLSERDNDSVLRAAKQDQEDQEGLDQRGIVLVMENTVLECIYICNVLQHNCWASWSS